MWQGCVQEFVYFTKYPQVILIIQEVWQTLEQTLLWI